LAQPDLAAGIPGAALVVIDSFNRVPLPQDPAWEDLMTAAIGVLGGLGGAAQAVDNG
jgi:hypothetical protein